MHLWAKDFKDTEGETLAKFTERLSVKISHASIFWENRCLHDSEKLLVSLMEERFTAHFLLDTREFSTDTSPNPPTIPFPNYHCLSELGSPDALI